VGRTTDLLITNPISVACARAGLLCDVSLVMASDVAETTSILIRCAAARKRPCTYSRVLHAHEIVLKEACMMAGQAAETPR
jgi:hypothetical protein